jgi:glutathione peroxidase-family protein
LTCLYTFTDESKTKECRKDFKIATEDEVKAGTSMKWDDWFKILDEVSIAEKGHDPVIKHLRKHLSLSQAWAQAVAMRYENDCGLYNLTA